ncbi:hypothetical protein LTR93_011781, partial [Exophiala xenobiotica]
GVTARRHDRGTSSKGGGRKAKAKRQSCRDASETTSQSVCEDESEPTVVDDAQWLDDTGDGWETTDSDSDSEMSYGRDVFWLGDELRKDSDLSNPAERTMDEDEHWGCETLTMGKRGMFRFF